MNCHQAVSSPDNETLKKTPQGSCLGISGQSRQVLEHPVAAQRLRGLNPSQPKDEWVEHSLDHLAHGEGVVALREPDMPGELITESQTLEKPMQESNSTELRQPFSVARNPKISWSIPHRSPPSLLMRVVSRGTIADLFVSFKRLARPITGALEHFTQDSG
jgi:hypothetical protein